jgi:protocatechuate 3,4-dioxygenase beta subunit
MKNKLLLPLFGVLVALMAYSWFALQSDPMTSDHGSEIGPVPGPISPPEDGTAVLAVPEQPREEANDRKSLKEAEEPHRETAIHSPQAVTSNAVWVSGRVLFPPKLPADGGEVELTARGRRFGGKKNLSDARREYVTRVEKDGTFRVAFAGETRKGWISVEGRYLYLPEKHKLDMRDLPPEVVIEPKLGGIVIGTVSLPAGVEWTAEARDETRVRIFSWGGGAMTSGSSGVGKNGAFELLGLPPRSSYQLRIESDLWCDFDESNIEVKAGEITRIEAKLTPGASVTGRIVDAEGVGISGVPVELTCDPIESGWHRQAMQTEAKGQFHFHGIVAGEVTLKASKQDSLAVEKELGTMYPGERRLDVSLLLDDGLAISGVVQWPGGLPAAGAAIAVDQQRETRGVLFGFNDTKSERAAEDGSFRITGLEDSPCVVRATARATRPRDVKRAEERAKEGKAPKLRRRGATYKVKLEDVNPGTSGLTLVLEKGDSVSGRVLDDRGEPLHRFMISARPETEGAGDLDADDGFNRLVVSLDGEFTIDGLRDGTWTISARTTGHAGSNSVVITSPGAADVELVAPRLAEVHGLVRDALGAPVSGATVWIANASDGEEIGPRSWRGGFGGGEATTDEEGRFEAKDIPPGSKDVSAGIDGSANSLPVRVEVKPGSETAGVICYLREAARLTGEVHSAAGGVAERRIRIRGVEGVSYSRDTRTDSTGHFEMTGLNPGTYELSLEAKQRSGDDWQLRQALSHSVKVNLKEGEHAHVLLGAPPSNPIRVRGRVSSGGEPVIDAVVICRAIGEHEGKGAARTGGDGEYEITLGEEGRYRFEVGEAGSDRLDFTRDVPLRDEVVIDFELPTASIEGVVRDEKGEPKSRCRVELEYEGAGEEKDGAGSRRSDETDDDGRYRLAHLRPGVYQLRVTSRQWRSWPGSSGPALGTVILEDLEIGAGEVKSGLDFDLEVGGSVTGVVLGTDGLPSRGARVHILTESGRSVQGRSSARSGKGGRFECEGLATGRYLVKAKKEGRESEAVPARIYSNGTTEVELQLEDG